jgi:hypothetical protein
MFSQKDKCNIILTYCKKYITLVLLKFIGEIQEVFIMGFLFWIITALLIAGLFVYLASVRTRRLLPQIELADGGWTLLVVVFLTVTAAGLVAWHGPQVWWDSDPVRLTVTLTLIAALLAYLGFTIGIRALEARDNGSFDERDSTILGRSCAGVGGAMMTILVVWMIVLTETYNATGLIPSYFLYLIFWSAVMTNVIASIAGILLAYRRS